MMALTANLEVDHYIDQELRSFGLAASATVFKGALVGLGATGYAGPLSAGDRFVGLAYEQTDNGTGADGDASVRVYTTGDFALTMSGATRADVGRPVFASAEDALTFLGDANSYVGFIEDVIDATTVLVRLDTGPTRIRTVGHAVEDLAAGADVAARAVHGFTSTGWITAARIVNQATAATGIDDTNPCVVTVKKGISTVATVTFNSTVPFPAPNTALSMGAITNARAAKDEVLTVEVTNGVTANPGPFVIEIDAA